MYTVVFFARNKYHICNEYVYEDFMTEDIKVAKRFLEEISGCHTSTIYKIMDYDVVKMMNELSGDSDEF